MKLWGDRALGGRVRISALGWAMGCHPGSDRCSRGAREDLRDLRICLAARHWRAGGGQAAPRVSRRADTHVHGRGHACGNALDAQRAGGSGRYGASSADNVAASAVVYSLPRGVKLRALGATGAAGTLPGGLIIGTAPSLAAVFVGGGEHTQEPRGERRAATRKKKIQDVGLAHRQGIGA